MRKYSSFIARVVALMAVFAIQNSANSQNVEPASNVRASLERLRSQLRTDESRYALWNESLLLDEVDDQLDAGDDFDPIALTKVIGAIAAAERPIDQEKLGVLREALADWLKDSQGETVESSAEDKTELKIGDASGDDSESSNDSTDQDDESNSENEPTTEGLSEDGAKRVADAANELSDWLSSAGRNYATWAAGLGLKEIISATRSPEDTSETDVEKQLSRIQRECEQSDRTAFVRLRRDLQAWQVAERSPIDEPLASQMRQRKMRFPGIDQVRMANVRNRLQNAAVALGAFLDTSEKHGENWKKYLEWEELNEAFTGDIPLVAPLESVYGKFNSGEPGLRVRQFLEVKQALKDYLDLLRLNETRPERLVEARRDLERSSETLSVWLGLASEKREGLWREFLDLETLSNQMDEFRPEVRPLQRVLKQFNAEEKGLEHPKFARVRDRLAKYIELLRVSSGPSATDIYTRRVEGIAQLIEQHILDPTNDSAAKLTRELRWLESTGLMPDLADRIKSLNAKPNFFAALSGDVITRALQDRITDTQGINRMFEGSRVTGTANTVADVRAQLVPSNNGIILDVLLNGSTVTNSVAQKRRVFVRTQGTTQINGGTRIYLGLDGVRATPASVSANTNQQVCNICINRRCTCGNRLIRRIASRKAEQSRPKAECTQTVETKQTIRKRIDDQTQQMVGRANAQWQRALSRLNIPQKYMPELGLRSTSRKVLSQGRMTVGDYLASVSDPPDVGSECDASVQIHQSAINNVLAEMLGGLRLDNELVVKMLEDNNLPVPAELQNGPRNSVADKESDESANAADEEDSEDAESDDEDEDNQYWSITFDELQPATATFSGGKVRISIRGRKFEQGDQEVKEPIEISANYRLRKDSLRQLEAKRIGDLDIRFVRTPGRLSTRQLAYKTAIKKRMELLFRRRISIDDLPTNSANPQVAQVLNQLRSVLIDQVEATRGWLALAFDLSQIDLKGQFGMASQPTTSTSAGLPTYSSRSVPASPVSCQNCQRLPRRRGLFRRRR